MRQRWVAMAALAALAASGIGCSPSGPPLAPLAGSVQVDGSPLAEGMLQFVPETGGGPAAVAAVEGGRFTAETAGRRGAVPGRYRIRVEARVAASDETDTLPKSLVAAKYLDPGRSGLMCEVVAGQDNLIDLSLESGR